MEQYTAFENFEIVARGDMAAMIAAQKDAQTRQVNLLIYDDTTGDVRDVDLRDVPATPRGRPKLGVKAREITLLPRHWEWLARQRGGASAVLRRLVEEAAKADPDAGMTAKRQAAAYAFLSSCAGDLPRFEEVIRALYASENKGFSAHMADWPRDVQQYAIRLAGLSVEQA